MLTGGGLLLEPAPQAEARATSQPLDASSSFTSSAPSPPAAPRAKPPHTQSLVGGAHGAPGWEPGSFAGTAGCLEQGGE